MDKTRYKSTYDQYNGITTLTILDLQEADEGQYEMDFLNSFSESKGSFRLQRKQKRKWRHLQMGS